VPSSSPPRWALPALLVLAAGALSGLVALHGINPHDEGLMLQAAARVADGQLPWRDFWWNYGPGQPLLLGGLQELFGASLLTWRIVRVALDALVALLVYLLARREAPLPLALAAWAGTAGAMAFPALPNPTPAALALSLGALLAAPRSAIVAGGLAGAASFFRLDMGLAAGAAAVLGATGEAPPGSRRAAAVRAGTSAALSASVLLGPFALAGGVGRFLDQTLGFAIDEQALQRLPLPGDYPGGFDLNKVFEFYFPYVLLAGGALWLVSLAARRASLRHWAPVPLALGGLLYLLARPDEFHLIPLAAVLPLGLAVEAARSTRPLALAALVCVGLVVLHGLDRKGVQVVNPPPLSELQLAPADGVKADPGEARALERAAAWVRERVPSGEPIFVANPRHDLVKVGNPLLYVLFGRSNPTRYDVMQPGVVTSEPVQREMVRDLRRARPGVVVVWRDPVATQREPNGAGRSSGVRILDGFLGRSYRPAERFGELELRVLTSSRRALP
jgi:hypothetical protein